MAAGTIWLVIAVVLGAAEIATLTAVLGLLGGAALLTAGVAAIDLPVPVQLLVFAATATAGLLVMRPIGAATRAAAAAGAGLPVPAGTPPTRPGPGSTSWVIPSEVTSALQGISHAFSNATPSTALIREPAPSREQPTKTVGDAVAASGARNASDTRFRLSVLPSTSPSTNARDGPEQRHPATEALPT